jgi:fructokinase
VGLDEKGVPSYSFYGQGCADRLLGADALAAVPAGLRAINFGSFTTVTEPTASTLRMLVEREHGRTLIAYDPNVRLNVEPDLARWHDQLQWMLPRTDLLKVSQEDLELLLPDTRIETFAGAALARGVKLVVVTRGGDGAQAWTAQATARVPTPAVTVIDTVGAGDTFQAALLTWLAEHDSVAPQALGSLSTSQLSQALSFAAQAAAITCSRRGADMPRRSELG